MMNVNHDDNYTTAELSDSEREIEIETESLVTTRWVFSTPLYLINNNQKKWKEKKEKKIKNEKNGK